MRVVVIRCIRHPAVGTGSKAILRDLLRREMGFNGVTVSDYSAVEQLESIYHLAESPADAGRLALEAGMDQELPTIAAYNDELKESIRSGVVQESLLDEAVLRILTMKFRLGLFENPFPAENVQAEITPADTALNRKIAQESMILLKNDGVLPLAKSAKKVAVIGWHADSVRALFGGYSALAMKENTLGVKMSMAGIQADADSPAAENAVQKTYPGSEVVMENPGVEPLARRCYPDAYSMLGALRLAAPHTEFLYAQGYPYAGNEESGHDAALQIAKDADLVICTLGGHYGWNASCTTGEGIDAMHIGLPVCQERFLEKLESLHKPVVGVHFDGHPISSDTADRVCNAILEAWAPGAQGGEAIAALLTGTANPCGKLPCTVARHEGQIPVYYNHPTNTCYSMTGGTPKNAYIDGAHTPRYCFGHGLSYTKYEYDTLRLEKDAIQADGVLKGRLHVRNAGNKAGTEIVQFYVHDVAASMVRPVKELVGFANYYEDRYEVLHKLHPERVLLGTETRHTMLPDTMKFAKTHPYLIGDFVWTLQSHLGEINCCDLHYEESEEHKSYPWVTNHGGVLDLTGQAEPSLHRYEFIWGGFLDKPVHALYLASQPPVHNGKPPIATSYRWTDTVDGWTYEGYEGKRTFVDAYTDADSVEIFVNGKSAGKAQVKDYFAKIPCIYEPGELVGVGYDADGQEIYRTSVRTADAETVLTVKTDKNILRAGGQDFCFADVYVTDKNGTVKLLPDYDVKIEVDGAASLQGYGSAAYKNAEHYDQHHHKSWQGHLQAVLRSTEKTGPVTVTFTADGCAPAILHLSAE